jgi:hypothetical protein
MCTLRMYATFSFSPNFLSKTNLLFWRFGKVAGVFVLYPSFWLPFQFEIVYFLKKKNRHWTYEDSFPFSRLMLKFVDFWNTISVQKSMFFSYVHCTVHNRTYYMYIVHCVGDKIICKKLHSYGHGGIWARICKRLRIPGVDSKESISPAM